MRRKDRQITEIAEIIEILDSCKTVCVAMIDRDMPYVVPLSYGYELNADGLTLYFHCAKEGRKIDVLKRNPNVCFTIFREGELTHTDTPCSSGYYYASVIGNGIVEFLDTPADKKYALKKLFAHQAGRDVDFTDEQAASVGVFRIVSKDYTGKRKPKK